MTADDLREYFPDATAQERVEIFGALDSFAELFFDSQIDPVH